MHIRTSIIQIVIVCVLDLYYSMKIEMVVQIFRHSHRYAVYSEFNGKISLCEN
jgi:hypothetical protein